MRDLKYSLSDLVNHKARVHRLYFIGAFLQAKVKNWVFFKLDSIYADYFPVYSNYFGRAFIMLNSVYDVTNSRKLFYGELI